MASCSQLPVDIDPQPSQAKQIQIDPLFFHFPVVDSVSSLDTRRSLGSGYNLFNFIISLWIVCLMSAHNHQPVHMSRSFFFFLLQAVAAAVAVDFRAA